MSNPADFRYFPAPKHPIQIKWIPSAASHQALSKPLNDPSVLVRCAEAGNI